MQANYILEKKLRSLNKKDVNKITKDINELVNEQNELQSIIKDESSLNKEIIKQMKFLKEEYGDDRKTKLITEEQDKKITEKPALQKMLALKWDNMDTANLLWAFIWYGLK